MEITISNELLDNFKLKNDEYCFDNTNRDTYNNKSGENEYRLYSYLTTFFSNIKILDIGTCFGNSSISLSHNKKNKVISYDVVDRINDQTHKIFSLSNVNYRIGDVSKDLNMNNIKNIKIILIDTDHTYSFDKKLLNKLKKLNYQGIVLLDDIHHHKEPYKTHMKKLWDEISEEKYDLSKYGHHSGTGIIIYGDFNIKLNML